MAFADIELRDNGSGTFDIALSTAAASTGNRNFFLFFDQAFLLAFLVSGISMRILPIFFF